MSSNEKMVMVPLTELARLQENMDPHRGAVAWGIVCDLLAKPAAQHQGEPVTWAFTDVDGKPVLCRQGDHADEFPLYTHPDAGKLVQLREGIARQWRVICDQRAELDTMRTQLAEAESKLIDKRDDLRASVRRRESLVRMVAERDALLRRIRGKLQEEYWDQYAGLDETRELIDSALSANAEPSTPKRETCKSCHGEGVTHTGIEESPTALCKRCDGSGNEPSAPVERDERAEFDLNFPDLVRKEDDSFLYVEDRNKWYGWQARAALERKP